MKKKILHVLSSSIFSGAENVAATLIHNLSSEYEMAYTSPDGKIREALKERNIHYIPMERFSIGNIRKIIKEWEPDILHAHDFTASIFCSIASFHIPVVSHIHQNPSWLKKKNLRSLSFTLACLKISKVIGVTSSIKDSSLPASLMEKKMSVIENIGDIKNIRVKASSSHLEDYYDLVFVGRLVDVKDPLRFIHITGQLAAKKPNLRAVIIGEGDLIEQCQHAIKELHLERNIKIQGFQSNPFPIMNHSKILVMTSKSEGFPMTLVEAFALGIPVVVPDIEGIERMVDQSCGLICKDDTDFIHGINLLLHDPITYLSMSKAAKYKAENLFNMEKYKTKFIEVYKHVSPSST